MPDVQVPSSPETRDYLNISETSNRSRLAVKTIYNWISLGRLGPREGVCSYAALQLSRGENPQYVAHQMGHTNLEMIIRHYAR
jgi:hypothetical protein